jgi:glyoxylase-like metal-dependent hydrolase (beta-lactamase superfamily II)
MRLFASFSRPLARAVLLALWSWAALAADTPLRAERVADGIHALIGPTGGRTYDNQGLNANFGAVATAAGTLLIDSGASTAGARLLEQQAVALTGQPVRWVINTGSQDHRWLGNAYFRDKGIEVIALDKTVATQKTVGTQQLDGLRPVLKDWLGDTRPVAANRVEAGPIARLELGGRKIELHYFADAHFPGDCVVWLPDERVLFAGDHVYTDRLLGILPQSNAVSWLAAFEGLTALQPGRIVPGHGSIADLAKARADTGDYLRFVVDGVKKLAEDLAGVDRAVAALGAAPRFAHLENFRELHRGNVSRAYLRLEAGQ